MRIRLCPTEALGRGRRRPCQCPGRLPPNFGGEEKEPRLCHALSCRCWVLPAKAHWSVLWGVVSMSPSERPIGGSFTLFSGHTPEPALSARAQLGGLVCSCQGCFVNSRSGSPEVFCVSLPVSTNVLENCLL